MVNEREKIFRMIAKSATPEQKTLTNKRAGYRMPPGYISQRALVEIDLGCLILCNDFPDTLLDSSPEENAFMKSTVCFGNLFNGWAKTSSPLYCVTKNMMEALSFTDSLSKKEILKNIKLPLQDLVIALPAHSLCCPGSEPANETYIDFLMVNCFYPTDTKDTITIGVFSIDINANSWIVKTEIDASGKIINNQEACEENHIKFFKEIRNLVISVLLLLQTSANAILSEVLPTETIDDYEKPKGFGKIRSTLPPKYPRWIGKNYQIKSERRQTSKRGGTHASPRAHWRSGHFRRLEPGEGKKWTEQKTLWIEPIFITGGIE